MPSASLNVVVAFWYFFGVVALPLKAKAKLRAAAQKAKAKEKVAKMKEKAKEVWKGSG